MNKTLKEYLSEIGRKGGKKSKRTWTLEQKERMVKKLMDTLKEKREKNAITSKGTVISRKTCKPK